MQLRSIDLVFSYLWWSFKPCLNTVSEFWTTNLTKMFFVFFQQTYISYKGLCFSVMFFFLNVDNRTYHFQAEDEQEFVM